MSPPPKPGYTDPADASTLGLSENTTTTKASPLMTSTAPALAPAGVVTVNVFLNTAEDPEGRSMGMVRGYRDGDPLKFGTSFDVDADADPLVVCEDAYAALNGHPNDESMLPVTAAWYADRNRSLSVGDVVAVNYVRYAVAKYGFTRLP